MLPISPISLFCLYLLRDALGVYARGYSSSEIIDIHSFSPGTDILLRPVGVLSTLWYITGVNLAIVDQSVEKRLCGQYHIRVHLPVKVLNDHQDQDLTQWPQNIICSTETTSEQSHKVWSLLDQECGQYHVQKSGFGLQPFKPWWLWN